MTLSKPPTKRKALALVAVLVLAMLFALAVAGVARAEDKALAAATVIYNFYATDGYTLMADGTPVYMYGFVGGRQGVSLTYQNSATITSTDPVTGAALTGTQGANVTVAGGPPAPTGGPVAAGEAQFAGNAQFPAPIIYAKVGDVVEIRLKNLGTTNPLAPNDPHSIHLHGLDVDAANDGVPETSVGAISANAGTPGAGNVIVYMFKATRPGTYMYHCHQEADIHVQMGMYGALIIYNPTDVGAVSGPGSKGNLFGFDYDKDVVMMLTEIDTRQHVSEEISQAPAFNPIDYHPQFWFINGLSFPNTIHADGGSGFVWTDWIAAHPGYDPLIVGSVSQTHTNRRVTKGTKVLIRVINLGFETQPMHMHGFHGKIIGSDQRAWTWANKGGITPFGQGEEKNTLTVGSGETYEWLVDFGQQASQSTYPPAAAGVPASTFAGGTQTRYNSITNLPTSNTVVADPAILDPANVPYIAGPVVTGAVGVPLAGQLFPFHNHDDYKATNNGAYPGGMFTMLLTLP
jgi:manganese oxidase